MSYILDALRRAEAERERGAVPGLHDQPFNPSSADEGARVPARRGLWIGAGLVLLLLLAALLGYALRSDPAPAPSSRLAEPAPQPETRTPAPSRDQPEPPQPTLAAMAPSPRPAYIDAPAPEPKPLPRKPPESGASATATAPVSPPASIAKPAEAEARVYALAELPDAIRRELPKLTMGGAMYSDSASSRMVIVNGQVLHEGDKLSADLSLVKINLKAAVFAFKGYRYELSY